METFTQAEGLGSDLVGAMARDTAGDLWVATFAGLSRLHEGKITNFTTADGLSSNVITALLPRAKGTLLIGTQDHGWNLWNGQGFERVTRDRLASHVDSRHSRRWAQPSLVRHGQRHCALRLRGHCGGDGGRGLPELDRVHHRRRPDQPRDGDQQPSFGVAGAGTAACGSLRPRAWNPSDPAHFPVNLVPPPVAIERFAVDDRDQPLRGAGDAISVPAGHNHFQFDYAGLSFVAPQKVRYRFMLDGFDHNWTDAGSRRIAYYTNIPPGHYTFRVQAANNDGVWNTQGAALSFDLRPHFYQTVWFYAVLALAMGAFVLLLFRLRLLRAEREFRAVLGERNRIAREIHDTLAQGYVGISVQLGSAERTAAPQQDGRRRQAPGHDARLCARGPGGCAPVHLVAALAGCDARLRCPCRCSAWWSTPAGMGWRRSSACTALTGPCRRARSAKSCAWPRKPSIM